MQGRRLVLALCVAQVMNLLPHVVVPAVMVEHLIPQWQLGNAQAGLMASAYTAGYMVAVPFLSSLADRVDARRILLWGSLASSVATIAFGWVADGAVSASALWFLAGVGFAGAYMPGLKALTDRLGAGDASRSVTLYTSSFSLGVGLSFLVAQVVADALGWRWAFVATGLGPLVMVATAARLRALPPPPAARGPLLDFAPVLRNRRALGFILGYGAHCFELYGMRTWIVAFWTFVVARHGTAAPFGPIAASVVVALLAMPASIIGNELAMRFGRRRAITAMQLASALVAITLGATAGASPWLAATLLLLYAITVPADSGALTAGMSAAADPARRGATMALHSMVGFGLSAVGGTAVGLALDAAGGTDNPHAWLAAFAVLGAGIACGPLALRWSRTD